MVTKLKGVEFDPGFGPYVLAFAGTTEYLYADINRFKNLSQKKVKFMQYYKKLLEILDNNLGFYVGCLMWAAYIKTQPEQEILNNTCFGQAYDEENNVAEVVFMQKFAELFPKDMKYFLGKNYEFDSSVSLILEAYKEFLTINKGFVESKTNTDILLPKNLDLKNVDNFKTQIEECIESGDLSKLLEYKDIVCHKNA